MRLTPTGLGRYRLYLLPAVALIMVVTLSITAILTERTSVKDLRDLARHHLDLFVAHLQGVLAKYEVVPEVLATDDRLLSPLLNPEDNVYVDFTNRYLKRINDITNASDIYLMNTSGLTVAASNWDSESPFVGENYGYRPYFQEAMKDRLGRYYALGATSDKRGYYFAYPIKRAENILGAVVVKIVIDPIENTWSGGPNEFIVTDPDGVIFITTKPQWKFRTLHALSPEVLQRIEMSLRYGDAEISPLHVISEEPTGESSSIVKLREVDASSGSLSKTRKSDYLMQGIEIAEAGWTVRVLSSLDPVRIHVYKAMLVASIIFILFVLTTLYVIQRHHRIREKMQYEQKARKAIEASKALILSIINNTRAGLIALDGNRNIESFNPMAEKMFGCERREVLGSPLTGLISHEDWDACLEQMASKLHCNGNGEHYPVIEVAGRRKDGSTFPMEITICQIPVDTGYRYIATIFDITELKRNEEALLRMQNELEALVQERTAELMRTNELLTGEIKKHTRTEENLHKTQEELTQAAKLAVLGEMSAAISHELNQPLSAIRSYSDNAQTLLDSERKNEVNWNLSQISELTARMAQIVKQLKMFARKSTDHAVAVSLQAVIDGAIEVLKPRIKRQGTKVINELASKELLVLGDMVRLEQVFVNLINNALEAMSNGRHRVLFINGGMKNNTVTVTVRDTGPGIPQQHLSQIFEPFFTTKEVGQGLGLGLSISSRIIHSFGGTIKVANHSEGGAVFTVGLLCPPSFEGDGI